LSLLVVEKSVEASVTQWTVEAIAKAMFARVHQQSFLFSENCRAEIAFVLLCRLMLFQVTFNRNFFHVLHANWTLHFWTVHLLVIGQIVESIEDFGA
jgi:hypothetical protein